MVVTIEYGPNEEDLILAGKSVNDAVAAAKTHWVLPETVTVRLNGEEVTDRNELLTDGDFVEIVKPSGDKGQ